MEYKLDITATRQAIMKMLDTFLDWCISQDDIDCPNCPYAQTCDNLHDIRDELIKMKSAKEREEEKYEN